MILDGTSSIHDPTKRNALSLFRRPALKTKQCTSAALVHLLPVNTVSTLDEYASIVFDSYITVQLQQSTRVDLVWDSYRQQHQSIYKTKVRQRNDIFYGMILIHKNCLSFSLRRSCQPIILMAKIDVIDSLMVGCSTCLIQTVDTDIVILVANSIIDLH